MKAALTPSNKKSDVPYQKNISPMSDIKRTHMFQTKGTHLESMYLLRNRGLGYSWAFGEGGESAQNIKQYSKELEGAFNEIREKSSRFRNYDKPA